MIKNKKTQPREDYIASFQLEKTPVYGRIVRFGPMIEKILSAHPYPETAACLLGEALLATALIGNRLKFKGKLILQAQGEGPVPMLVAEYTSMGTLRGFAKHDDQALASLQDKTIPHPPPNLQALLGHKAHIILTLCPDDAQERYQSIVALEGETLAKALETYFETSEQMPTRMMMAMAQYDAGDGHLRWRGGGMLVQRYPDKNTENAEETWIYAKTIFSTLKAEEMVDPDLSSETLLYRLFHEEGVRMAPPSPLKAQCSCSGEKIAQFLASVPEKERLDLVRNGFITSHCEYCHKVFRFTEKEIEKRLHI